MPLVGRDGCDRNLHWFDDLDTQDTILIALSVGALVASVIAAVYSVLAYRLKSGIEIRGSYSVMSSIAADDRYVHEVILENLKDRAVVVFKIFLELDYGNFIEIEEFKDEPLILRPFEAVRRRYGPLDYYSVGTQRIRIDGLLGRKSRRRLVLSTAQGRYVVSSWVPRWDPVFQFFRNHTTALIYPVRLTYEGTPYGSGTKYIVRIKTKGRQDEILPIYQRDSEVRRFRSFQLTPEALASRDALETFLLEEATAGRLRCTDLEVFDMDQWRKETLDHYDSEALDARPRSWLGYHVAGWLATKWDDFELWRVNRATRKKVQTEKRQRERNSHT